MSSVGYMEVARKGNLPVIEWRQLDEREVLAEASGDGARLRVFFSRVSEGETPLTAPFSSAYESLILIKQMARPDSAFREHIHDLAVKTGSGEWTFFQAKSSGRGGVEPLRVHSWGDLARWFQDMSQVFAVEGNVSEVLGLLDSIGEQAGSRDRPQREVVEDVSPAKSHQAAIDFRNELLAEGWPDGKRVAEMAGASVGKNPAQYAARLRSGGALLGVWDAPERTFRHPDFQFDTHGQLRSEVAKLLAVLPGADDDRGGWRRAFWLYSPHAQLGNETPAAVFPRDAERVIEVAKREFRGDRDARW
ncbi:hypothetical protein [Paraburkholderia sp. BR14374]|uniref:hypothetical protein n=1 Tax=Paraburkholderia sp. BR14374 TaxID=3237007 RepID=UPI0034CFFBD1